MLSSSQCAALHFASSYLHNCYSYFYQFLRRLKKFFEFVKGLEEFIMQIDC